MIKFLLIGLLRDKSRSRVPIMIVALGVMLSVFLHAYITGVMGDSIELNANMNAGHVKVVTKAYAENMSQMPVDLALTATSDLAGELKQKFPDVTWVERIQFGGLIDVPDQNGETRSQGPAVGMGVDLLSGNSDETKRLNLSGSLAQGRMPQKPFEILLSNEFAQKLGVKPGDEVTLMSSTMNGSMSYQNFILAGTLSFGVKILDKGTMIADINDVRTALDMDNAASEINGYFNLGYYSSAKAIAVKESFLKEYPNVQNDEYAPTMITMKENGLMGQMIDMTSSMGALITSIFLMAMALVLWNAGLLGGIRRYGEFGVRLAMGEEKKHVYRTLIYESVMIGIAGSIIGTALGLFFSWIMQTYGFNISDSMKGSSVMLPSVLKARITPVDYYIGFIPGILSTVVGTALAGIGIYKRKTSQLFKELEA